MEKQNPTVHDKSTHSPIKVTALQHKINTKTKYRVSSYDIQPGNGEGLFWHWRFINLSLTYLLRHLPTYLQPRTHTWQTQCRTMLVKINCQNIFAADAWQQPSSITDFIHCIMVVCLPTSSNTVARKQEIQVTTVLIKQWFFLKNAFKILQHFTCQTPFMASIWQCQSTEKVDTKPAIIHTADINISTIPDITKVWHLYFKGVS